MSRHQGARLCCGWTNRCLLPGGCLGGEDRFLCGEIPPHLTGLADAAAAAAFPLLSEVRQPHSIVNWAPPGLGQIPTPATLPGPTTWSWSSGRPDRCKTGEPHAPSPATSGNSRTTHVQSQRKDATLAVSLATNSFQGHGLFFFITEH